MTRKYVILVFSLLLSVAASAQKVHDQKHKSTYRCDTLRIVSHHDDENAFYHHPLYQTITPENLTGFISEWKAYSYMLNRDLHDADSTLRAVASTYDINAALLAREYRLPHTPDSLFVVVNESIPVQSHGVNDEGEPLVIIRNITPSLPAKGLYINDAIDARLRAFINVTEYGEIGEEVITNPTNMAHLALLRQYIPVSESAWGSWDFMSYPAVTQVLLEGDDILLNFQANNTQGCQVRYVKSDDEYVPDTELYSIW